jgi:hypothetical protein
LSWYIDSILSSSSSPLPLAGRGELNFPLSSFQPKSEVVAPNVNNLGVTALLSDLGATAARDVSDAEDVRELRDKRDEGEFVCEYLESWETDASEVFLGGVASEVASAG